MTYLHYMFLIALLTPAPTFASSADSLYQIAIALPESLDTKDRIRAFKRVLDEDFEYAPAHAELAELYMSRRSPEARQDAERAIQRALRVAPDNLDYQFILGELMRQKRFWNASEDIIQKIIDEHPDYAPAQYLLGEEALDQFLLINYNRPGAHQFARQDYHRAQKHFKRCIQIDPDNRNAYYKLGLLYLESNQPAQLVSTMKRLLKQYPNDADGLLYCALGYQRLGIWTKTDSYYTQALKHMDRQLFSVMHDLKHIVTETERYAIMGKNVSTEQSLLERERFWRKQDPLYLTDNNERILEHYSRVAYANLRFSNPRLGIKGYETDRGKTYIRFGQPIFSSDKGSQTFSKEGGAGSAEDFFADRGRNPNLGGQSYYVSSPKKTWYYEGFQVTFESYIPRGKWYFGGYVYEEVLAMLNQGLDPIPTGNEVFHKQKPRFVDPFSQIKYQPPHIVAAFQEGEQTRIELAYALPKSKLNTHNDVVDLTDGLFLFDQNWDKVDQDVRDITYLPTMGVDTINRKYLLAQRTLHIKPGQYNLVTETLDRKTQAIGATRNAYTFAAIDTGLAISDLLPASLISALTPFPEKREDLRIVPNPLRTYKPTDPVYLYLEVYNLKQDPFARTHFDITYRVSVPQQKEIDLGLFTVLDAQKDSIEVLAVYDPNNEQSPPEIRVNYKLPEQNKIREILSQMREDKSRTETRISAEYEGHRTNDFTFLEIDVSRLLPGIYKLTVTITDRQTQQRVETETLFRIHNML